MAKKVKRNGGPLSSNLYKVPQLGCSPLWTAAASGRI